LSDAVRTNAFWSSFYFSFTFLSLLFLRVEFDCASPPPSRRPNPLISNFPDVLPCFQGIHEAATKAPWFFSFRFLPCRPFSGFFFSPLGQPWQISPMVFTRFVPVFWPPFPILSLSPVARRFSLWSMDPSLSYRLVFFFFQAILAPHVIVGIFFRPPFVNGWPAAPLDGHVLSRSGVLFSLLEPHLFLSTVPFSFFTRQVAR